MAAAVETEAAATAAGAAIVDNAAAEAPGGAGVPNRAFASERRDSDALTTRLEQPLHD
jgi:hypothetical protein